MMTRLLSKGMLFGGAAAATIGLAACQRAADLSCDQIAQKAQELSQRQEVRFNEIRDVREVSRTETERRCTGNGVTTTGQTIALQLRGYEENGNQMVSYEGQAPTPPPAGPPAGDQPAAGGEEQPPAGDQQ